MTCQDLLILLYVPCHPFVLITMGTPREGNVSYESLLVFLCLRRPLLPPTLIWAKSVFKLSPEDLYKTQI